MKYKTEYSARNTGSKKRMQQRILNASYCILQEKQEHFGECSCFQLSDRHFVSPESMHQFELNNRLSPDKWHCCCRKQRLAALKNCTRYNHVCGSCCNGKCRWWKNIHPYSIRLSVCWFFHIHSLHRLFHNYNSNSLFRLTYRFL